MKINVITPVNKGGPFNWGKSLAETINGSYGHNYSASHIHEFKKIMKIPLYQDHDIVHTAVPLTYKLWRKPVVLTIHGEFPIEKNIWRHFYPIAIKKANIITTPSNFLKDRLGINNAIVIPNAVFPGQFRTAEHGEKEQVSLVTLTKFSFKDKAEGVLDLIKIVENVQRHTDIKIKYTVIGGGKYLDYVKDKITDVDLDLYFTGFLNDPKEVLKENDIFLYYSIHDNFPIAILEAMATGLPVITNDVGAVREMISSGKNGYVPDSSDEYERYLIDMISDHRSRARIGRNARNTIENRFSWHKIIKEYRKIYDSLS
ncbi:hypothetical protein CUJ83_07680 [Methanocella sp. CWC-04]|uniref:Glycosyl transferase family 1 domain-containing protein n=1 Tax=Methanooceanicella nereidis TaxID=2052831 RepID=A0AAP2RDN3_9EURY|nr:glycosyltransferase family 4 protein [Methanocella sp. CWC-04]MCD1294876.1 hypothetical protein [Methanocella sp. CWC-04]